MLMSDHRSTIAFGNTFSEPAHQDKKFDYMLANPPFGVEWKKVKESVETEAELGYGGRFGVGLPRINDGSFLFLQHMISRMEPVEGKGCRLAIVFNGSPSSPAPPSPASRKSGSGFWRRPTCWKASSPYPTSSSTTPGSPPTSGSCPTAKPQL